MKLVQHINIASYIYDKHNLKDKGIYRLQYLFGSIAPDLNCVYPAHRLSTTERRFSKRLDRVNNINNKMIKSFTLGVITHYICDYFCIAHNNESLGIKHKAYETGLWKEFKEHYDSIIENDNNNYNNYVTDILEYIKKMNFKYKNEIWKYLDDHWDTNKKLMIHDILYAREVCDRVVWSLVGVKVN